MSHQNLDWTHKYLKIKDIRKFNKLYVISVIDPAAQNSEYAPLFIKDTIFEERLRSYFLKDICQISRKEILELEWNMYITKGYYIKINEKLEVSEFHHDADKWYVSYLEVSGVLGEFCSVYSSIKESYKSHEK